MKHSSCQQLVSGELCLVFMLCFVWSLSIKVRMSGVLSREWLQVAKLLTALYLKPFSGGQMSNVVMSIHRAIQAMVKSLCHDKISNPY